MYLTLAREGISPSEADDLPVEIANGMLDLLAAEAQVIAEERKRGRS